MYKLTRSRSGSNHPVGSFAAQQPVCPLTLLLLILVLLVLACGPGLNRTNKTTATAPPGDAAGQGFFVTPDGDTLPIGLPIPIKGRVIPPDSLSQPKTVPMHGQPKVVPALTNRRPTGVPKIIQISGNRPIITPGKDGVPLPQTITVKGKEVPFEQIRIVNGVTPKFKESAVDNIQYLSVEEGLSGARPTKLLEDRKGNLWWGYLVDQKIDRYDGTSLITYRYPGIRSSLALMDMLEDSRGNIWFGTLGDGLGRFDGQRFTRFTTLEGFPADEVLGLLEDKRGNIWIGTLKGLVCYTPDDAGREGRFTLFTDKEGLRSNLTGKLMEDRRGKIWFATWSGWNGPGVFTGYGVTIYTPNADGNGGSFSVITEQDGLCNGRINEIFEDSRDDIWLGTDGGGVLRFTPDAVGAGGTLACFTDSEGLSNNSVKSITEDKNHHIWIGTVNGLNQFIPAETGPGGYFVQYTEKNGLLNHEVFDLLTDDRGNIWAGVVEGINRVVVNSFAQFTQQDGLLNNSIRNIQEDKQGDLWLATNGGLCLFSTDAGNESGRFTHITEAEGLSGNPIVNLWQDKDGTLLCTAGGGAVNVLSPPAKGTPGQFTYYTQQEGAIPNPNFGLLKDRRGNIWSFGYGNNGFCCIGPPLNGNSRIVHFTKAEGWPGYTVDPVLEDRNGALWLATWGAGLCRFEPNQDATSGTLTFYPDNGGLQSNRLHCLLEDSAGRIWFGTNDGLRRFKPGVDKIPAEYAKCTTKEGLINDEVFSIAEDRQKNIWVATAHGLSLLMPDSSGKKSTNAAMWAEYRIFNFDKADGLQQIDFWVHSVCADSKNRMWWGGPKGLTTLDLNRFELPTGAPKVQLSHIEVNQQFVDYRKLADTAYANTFPFGKALRQSYDSVAAFQNYPVNLKLPHNLSLLTFHCSATDWAAPHKIRFSYKMNGLDEDWSKPQQESFITYRNLPHGTYTFQVKAYGAGQLWSEPFEYTFTILPPWWATWWARALYAIAALALLYFIRDQELKKQQRKLEEAERLNDRLQQVDKLKDQFLANTSHELRTPLQGIIGLSESLAERVDQQDQQEDLSMIISSGKRLSSLVNDILDLSKLKNFDIDLVQKPLSLHALTDIVLRNNAPLVRGKALELINAVSPDLPATFADENRLQQVLYNLVGNAIKFTETGHVKVDASEKDGSLEVSVEDTGIGIPENKRESIFQEFQQGDGSVSREFAGTGLGLSISKQLVELHGGKMWVESTVGKGSVFFFTLPLSTEKASTLSAVAGRAQPALPVSDAALKPETALNAGEKVHILVVDDEPINQRVLKNHLASEHFRLTQVLNGEEALRALDSGENFDLVLLDIMMPRMSGYEVCQKIRERHLPSELPVIMITAKNQIQDIVQGLSYGANDYLPKPFHKDELLARIKTQVDLHRIFDVAGRFVPNAFLHSLNRERITEVALGDHTEQEVTVMFCDIRDYTVLAETMTPEENFRFVSAFNRRMGPVIRKHGGFINQYLGDAIMAIFPKEPAAALHAAVEMQQILQAYNAKRQAKGREALKMGIGMQTGPLIMGIIGDENRMDAATIADTVNTASRIESLTKYYGVSILLSEDSLQKIGDKTSLHLRYLGKVQVKGKKVPVSLHECFNGDTPEVAAQKLETRADFENGLTLYFNRTFAEAAAVFNQVLQQSPEDHAARLFLHKASKHIVDGVSADWTGVEVMTFK